MYAICATPIRVYNSVEKKPEAAPKYRHWRQRAINPEMSRVNHCQCQDATIRQLTNQITEYKMANKRLKTLVQWNLRSTKSALKDVEQMLQIIEDLYGEETPKSE
jgi:hypothetical protein